MEKSASLQQIATALAKAQGEMRAAEMTATNPFLKSKYADLGAVIQAAKATLAKHGLSVVQPVSGNGEFITVTTLLMHESGEWIQETISLPLGEERGKSQAQVAGSIVTYLRRYSLASMLGMYSDEDADGNAPTNGKVQPTNGKPQAQPKPAAQPEQPPAEQKPAYAYPEEILTKLGEQYKLHPSRVLNTLKMSNLPTDCTIGAAMTWMAAYKTARDQDMTPQEAAAAANG